MQALQHGDVGGEADGEGRQQDMPSHDPGELEARQDDGIEAHCTPLIGLKPSPANAEVLALR